jgi:hypothetical protein
VVSLQLHRNSRLAPSRLPPLPQAEPAAQGVLTSLLDLLFVFLDVVRANVSVSTSCTNCIALSYCLTATLHPQAHNCDWPACYNMISAIVRFVQSNDRCSSPDVVKTTITLDAAQLLQVMHSDWCKRLDRDIFAHHQGKDWTFPCWKFCVLGNEELLRLTHRAHEEANSSTIDYENRLSKFVPYGWCLPHLRWQEVQEMLTAVKAGRDPSQLNFVSDGE